MDMRTEEIRIGDIRIAGRIRKEEGDLEGLAGSIRERGLINPITVMEMSEGGYLLLAGERRINAGRMLGWETIRATVVPAVDAEEQLRIEVAENEERKEFTLSEKLEFSELFTEIEREKAKQRMADFGRIGGLGGKEIVSQRSDLEKLAEETDGNKGTGNCPYPWKGESREIVAKKSGFSSARQMNRVKEIADKRPDFLGKIDSGEMSVNAAYRIATGAAGQSQSVGDDLPEPALEEQPMPGIPGMPEPIFDGPQPEDPDDEGQDGAQDTTAQMPEPPEGMDGDIAMQMPEPEEDADPGQGQDAQKAAHAEAMARSRRNVVSWERPDLMELVDGGVISLDTAYCRTLKARREAKEEDEQYEGIPKLPGHVLMARLTPEERRRAREIEATMVKTQEFTIDTEIPGMFRPADYATHERLMEEPIYAELYEHDRKLQAAANLIRGELITKCENYEKRIRSYEENVQSMRQMIQNLREQMAKVRAGNDPTESEGEDL